MSDLVHPVIMSDVKLKKMAIFKASQAKNQLNIGRHTLARRVQQGTVQRLSRGLYIHPKIIIDPEILDFAIACAHFGKNTAIGGLSALFYYRLINQAPQQVWIIIPKEKKSEGIGKKYKCLRTSTSFSNGISTKKYFKITNIERTLLESLKFSTKIGIRTSINAARQALENRLTTEKKLALMAKKLKMKRVLKKYWEVIVI